MAEYRLPAAGAADDGRYPSAADAADDYPDTSAADAAGGYPDPSAADAADDYRDTIAADSTRLPVTSFQSSRGTPAAQYTWAVAASLADGGR